MTSPLICPLSYHRPQMPYSHTLSPNFADFAWSQSLWPDNLVLVKRRTDGQIHLSLLRGSAGGRGVALRIPADDGVSARHAQGVRTDGGGEPVPSPCGDLSGS